MNTAFFVCFECINSNDLSCIPDIFIYGFFLQTKLQHKLQRRRDRDGEGNWQQDGCPQKRWKVKRWPQVVTVESNKTKTEYVSMLKRVG